ncbi:UNVERIFIED_CONTAM: hypothetical protein FKN15_043754 [Acipenser sinensis]
MSPSLLVLVDGQTDSWQDSVSIPPSHHWDSTYEFLTELKGFLSAMLHGENEGPPLQLHVDLDSLQSLPHGYLNASSEDVALLRQLLESHAPTLFRFPRRLEDLRGHRVELLLEADLLDLLNTRLTDTVAQIQRQMELQNHGGLPQLQRLLRGCFHLTQGLGVPSEETPANPRQRQYHSLLLLKALQTVLSAWDQRGQRQKPTRQDRSQEHHTDCGLRELSVSLLEYKHILQPKDLSTPTLFRFPRRLEDLRGHRVELLLEEDLLDLLNTRLTDTVAQIQRQMELQNHGGLPQLQRLLRGCFHLTQGLGVPSEETPANPRQRQYHSLLLLKALQTVLSAWDQRGQRQKPTRQDRSQEHHTDCGLRELSVSLLEYKHILQPKDLSIGNCQGHCRFPLADSDRYEHNNHAVLLLRQHERGPGLERAPCCVPVMYREVQY